MLRLFFPPLMFACAIGYLWLCVLGLFAPKKAMKLWVAALMVAARDINRLALNRETSEEQGQ